MINSQNDKINLDSTSRKIKIPDLEKSPIINYLNSKQKSIEEFYRNNFPEFELFKFHNTLMCKMGKMITFNFDKNFIPKYCIGPHWYLTIFLNILILIFGLLLYFAIIIKTTIIQIIIYLFLLFLIYYMVNRTALINPGIVLNKKRGKNDNGYCNICKIYFDPYNNVEHCRFCGVCIERMDHHCVWVGKCVGKKNIKSFWLMVLSVAIFYIYTVVCALIIFLR